MARIKVQNVTQYPIVLPPPVGGYLQPGEMTAELDIDLYTLQRDRDFGAALTKGFLRLVRIDTDTQKPDSIEIGSLDQVAAYLHALKALLPPLTGQAGAVLMEFPVGQISWGMVQGGGGGPVVSAFNASLTYLGSSQVEVGQTLATPSFTAAYNRLPTVASMVDSDGHAAINVTANPTAFQSPHSFTKNTYGQGVTFTLQADDGTGQVTSAQAVTWLQRVYYGTAPSGGRGAAFIKSLANKPLASSKNRSFTVDASGPNDSIYYAYRSAYGSATFLVGLFEGGFDLVDTVAVINDNGFTDNYFLYESTNPGLGLTTIGVN